MTIGAASTSVVVSTYDAKRWDDLIACVIAIEQQSRKPLEVIVVVDHNRELLERAAGLFPNTRVVANRRSRGLAGARNTGIEIAKGDIIAFIDDDACAEENWLGPLEDCFCAPETVGAGGALLPLWQGPTPSWFPPEFYWVVGCSYKGLPEQLAPVRNPIGANMAVRASVLNEVGGFREGLTDDAPRELRGRGVVRAGGNVPDDTDLAIRITQRRPHGIWLYQPRARVRHTVTSERASFGYFLRRSFEEGVGKASLSRLIGASSGLASERRYLATVLPKSICRDFGRFLRGDRAAALRALAIAAGSAAAGAGFLSVALARSGGRRRPRGERRAAMSIANARPDAPEAEQRAGRS
jgi:glycosyltransferase involved in cell wall biosynthesis